MKKTLIALVVAASAVVSGSSVAALGGWTEGQPGNAIDIGGSITVPTSDMKWLWAVGDGMNNYNNAVTELLNERKKLTIPINNDTPFLAAKMNKAVSLPILGIIPKVEFTSYDQSSAVMNFQDEKSATLTVKVKNAKDMEIGSLVIPLQFGAGATNLDIFSELGHTEALMGGLSLPSAPGGIFEGITKPGTTTKASLGLKWSGLTTNDVTNAMVDTIRELGLTSTLSNTSVDDTAWSNYADLSHGNYTSSTHIRYVVYGAGIPSGSSLTLTFSNSITEETEWRAPVTVNVTYQ
ncbi:F41 fimbrial protein [Escherichia coli]|uniref:F4 family fimbrial subunit n=1 Tax=Escherichia coli TaxID=562 RepID=UPI00137AABE9|nr:F41 fimbrial protein [Escherichia coli]